MKLLKLVVCVSFLLSNVGCAAHRECLVSRPAQSAESSPTADATESCPPVSVTKSQPHPIRDKVRGAAELTTQIILLPLTWPFILIAASLGALPKC